MKTHPTRAPGAGPGSDNTTHDTTHDTTPSSRRTVPRFPRHVTIRPWIDPVVDERGHDPRSLYVEQFWLGVIGPTATWLLRRLVARFDQQPDGYRADFEEVAGELGLSLSKGRGSHFGRALHRCVMFGAAQPLCDGTVGWEVRRRLPTVAHRHLRRLPDAIRELHLQWDHTATVHPSGLERARCLADAMIATGDDPALVEPQLVTLGISPRAASTVCQEVLRAS